MTIFGSVASQEGIERVESMHEAGLLKKLERPVDCLRCRIATILRELGENIVGADRFVLPPYNLEDSPANWREIDSPSGTDPLSRRDGALDAPSVIVGRPLSLH
jgi:hypothetical protein